jgi:hypothetical protein
VQRLPKCKGDTKMKHAIGLLAAMMDENLFGRVFATPSMWTWRVVAKLVDGIPLIEERERTLFYECTGIQYNRHNRRAVRRLILLCGRRAGKDRFLSAVAIWRAALCANWKKYISPGEQAVVILLGADRRQGNILSKYCAGLLEPKMLSAEVVRHVRDVIEFRNGSSLEISTNDARLIRGRSAIAVLGSECCHWKTAEHSESSDEEVVGAAEPSLSMCPDQGMIVLGSSVYRKKGYMYRQWKQKWGHDDADTLVWMAPSTKMNPKLPQHIIDTALATDSSRALAEYMCEWRSDLSDFIPHDVVEAATDFGVYERAPVPHVQYFEHADAAGGTGMDSFCLAISHRDTSYTIDRRISKSGFGVPCMADCRGGLPQTVSSAMPRQLHTGQDFGTSIKSPIQQSAENQLSPPETVSEDRDGPTRRVT